eukprot:gnl/TRDRNA2_/TRDRNA2_175402_c0_seq1.p1 gnl/TRDRNA2_/TRDRNA2_175402_c0~~gnl/TRDRNA2_/TRDRNA2_175402_c0_seq1.p1  ORF type:complete len:519 (+),score=30.65 gnl/TRDRNA2_/TRDRNA2_175402_c0_seq1:80-1636(+)
MYRSPSWVFIITVICLLARGTSQIFECKLNAIYNPGADGVNRRCLYLTAIESGFGVCENPAQASGYGVRHDTSQPTIALSGLGCRGTSAQCDRPTGSGPLRLVPGPNEKCLQATPTNSAPWYRPPQIQLNLEFRSCECYVQGASWGGSNWQAMAHNMRIRANCDGKQLWKPDNANGWSIWRAQIKWGGLRMVLNTQGDPTAQNCLRFHSNSLQAVWPCPAVTDATYLFKIHDWQQTSASESSPDEQSASPSASGSAAAIQDDPEITNVHGEHFKINDKGGITLLHIPREAPTGDAFLVMVAEIQELAQKGRQRRRKRHHSQNCIPTYVRNLLITGTALGDLKVLTFHARNKTAPFLFGFGKLLKWLPDGAISNAAMRYYTKTLAIPKNISLFITEDEPGYPSAIDIKIGRGCVTVRRPHIPEGKHFQFLNIEVNELDSFNYSLNDYGGVLGVDMPSAPINTGTCLSSKRKWRKHKKHRHPSISLAALPAPILQGVEIDSDADMQSDGDDIEESGFEVF